MQPIHDGMTVDEIAQALQVSRYSTQRALDALGLRPVRSLQDRRRYEYPASVKEKVKQWLQTH